MFGKMNNLEEKSSSWGNFDKDGKLQGYGSIDGNFKGEFKQGWLDGYCHILTETDDKTVDELYCGNAMSGVLSGFGVLVKKNMRYFGSFKNENMTGYGVLEFWSGEQSTHLRELEFENLAWGQANVKSKTGYAIFKGEFKK